MSGIALNIFSGLGSVVAGWLLKKLWDWRGKYFLSHMAYSGTKVEGKWRTILGTEGYEEEVTLKRFGPLVYGSIKVINSPTKADVGKSYTFKGLLRDGYLTGEYSITEDSKFDVGMFFLSLKNGGNQLCGISIGYHDPTDQIKTWQYQWARIA